MPRKIFLVLFLLSPFLFLNFFPREIVVEKPANLKISLLDEKDIFGREIFKKSSFFLPFYLEEFQKELIEKKENFIEIDLQESQIYLYKKGEVFKKIPILTAGQEGNWGETPVGLFKVLSKNALAFSQSEELFMPYAINFWGKYFIHGPPYSSGGVPFSSPFSGGVA